MLKAITSAYRFAEACNLKQGGRGDVPPRGATFAITNGLKVLAVRRGEGQRHPTETVSSGELLDASGDRVWRAGDEALPSDFPECLGGDIGLQ